MLPHDEAQAIWADIILPIPLPKLLTYRVPESFQALMSRGSRVIVPLGQKKIVTGLVEKLHTVAPAYATKDVMDLLDEAPIVQPHQLDFFHWLANYYLCTVGEVMLTALPNGLRLSSQSKIQLHPELDTRQTHFSDQEEALIQALQRRADLTYAEAATVVNQKSIHHLIKSLLHKKAILLFEEVREKYKPKKVKKVRLHERYLQQPEALKALIKTLERSPKQLDALLKYITQVPIHQTAPLAHYFVDKQTMVQGDMAPTALQTLLKKQILVEEAHIVSRFGAVPTASQPAAALSPAQQTALEAIQQQWQKQDTVLLHGVTASGKTEVYIQLIQTALQQGGQVLYLLPEIALTAQMVKRLQKVFGDQVSVYHSKYSDNERVEVWRSVLEGTCAFVLGTRSALFLPFQALRLLIVDEEHEISYKQFDSMPRYHARDTALVLAQHHQAKVLLGSATPALETYYNAQTGKYGLVTLEERFGQTALPEVVLANVRTERTRKTMREDFTSVLLTALRQTLDQQEQAIVFQNRRGYAPYITCEDCAWVPMCTECAVSLTYHQFNHYLRCHYCGYHLPMPPACSVCGSYQLKNVGYGTEKLEESLQLLFPTHSIQRMDLDTTRGKHAYDKIIEALEQGKTDILVGTQMVTKGLDFGEVSLVGVLDIDRLLHFPDFRSGERCFQLMTQVSGRAGRRSKQGQVVIQTAYPEHPVLQDVVQHNYMQLYHRELAERQQFLYPPYVRLVRVTLKHAQKDVVVAAASTLANTLRTRLKESILGPQAPVIARLHNQYLMDVWIKLRKTTAKQLVASKQWILQAGRQLLQDKALRQVKVVFDVDPV